MHRVIDLEGCLNFRDLGGYPTEDGHRVRWRRVFRADGLHLLTPADLSQLRGDLDVRDVVDLRSTSERSADPPRPLDGEANIRVHHEPLFDGDTTTRDERASAAMTLAERYLALAGLAKAPIARTLEIIARSEGSCVYHCAAGKDRTGIVSAILLGLLGVHAEVIVADYAATRENLDEIIDRLMGTRGYDTMLGELPPDTLHAEPETMVGLLEGLRREYGSVQAYASDAGMTAAVLHQLRAALLEPA